MPSANPPPSTALCLTCDYPLRDLAGHRCPECGREFDPTDADTMHLGRPRGRIARMLVQPTSPALVVLAVIAAIAMFITLRLPLGRPSLVDVRFYLNPRMGDR